MKRASAKQALRAALVALVISGISACSTGGGPGEPPLQVVNFNFAPGFGGVPLNAPLVLTFSTDVNPASVTPDSIRIFTTTTTTAQTDPGAPAVGVYLTSGNVVTFLPQIPRRADLADAGLSIGFSYAIQVPAAPDVIEPVRSTEGRPNVVPFQENFTTINHTILPAPGDILAEPNLGVLHQFFIEENIENGVDPCDRDMLLSSAQNSPQVVETVPLQGETGFGTITGIAPGLGTAFVRLDPIRLTFSEPIGTWRVREENIAIRNENLGGETFDLFFFFTQNRADSTILITVFDKDSSFDQASVPQGRFTLSLTEFCDLAGNLLVNSATCDADGTFSLSFSTVSSPSLPTDLVITFGDDDSSGHVDVGGVPTPQRNPNEFPTFARPFLSGFSSKEEIIPSNVRTNANWGGIGYWDGRALQHDNGFRGEFVPDEPVPTALLLRGGVLGAGTAVMAPVAGKATGATDVQGSAVGLIPAPNNKFDFLLVGGGSPAQINTGNDVTGPIVYQVRRFSMLAVLNPPVDPAVDPPTVASQPTLTTTFASIYPLLYTVEEDVQIEGTIEVGGGDGDFGFDGANDGSGQGGRDPGGAGGRQGPGGGTGGHGGCFTLGTAEDRHGLDGSVPVGWFGALDEFSQAMAGQGFGVEGGGGRYDDNQTGLDATHGGGGGAHIEDGTDGANFTGTTPGESDRGIGGKAYRSEVDEFRTPGPAGGAGGGGGSSEDDGAAFDPSDPNDPLEEPNGVADIRDDGGGGGGGGGGMFCISAGGDITIGTVLPAPEPPVTDPPTEKEPDTLVRGTIRALGGRGGSTWRTEADAGTPGNNQGSGSPGGGGAGGGISIIAAGNFNLNVATIFAFGRRGGDAAEIEMGDRDAGGADEGGSGGAGLMYFADIDGIDIAESIVANDSVDMGSGVLTGTNTGEFSPEDPSDTTPEELEKESFNGTAILIVDTYNEANGSVVFGVSRIVTEFFDTLSKNVVYDNCRVLSNAPDFIWVPGDPTDRTIRVFVDATVGTGPDNNAVPDLSEEAADGSLGGGANQIGASLEIELDVDSDGDPAAGAEYDALFEISDTADISSNRYVRMRVEFDLGTITTVLLDSFAPPGLGLVQIAPGNSLGNLDAGFPGVPAIADLRVRFIP
ncbi:MAG: Ig-like domain-containing protein [Planctomycetota bacterium]